MSHQFRSSGLIGHTELLYLPVLIPSHLLFRAFLVRDSGGFQQDFLVCNGAVPVCVFHTEDTAQPLDLERIYSFGAFVRELPSPGGTTACS